MGRRKGQHRAGIASRKVSKNRKISGEFLEGTESNVVSVGAKAATGFREAWAESVDESSGDSFDLAINVGQDDSEARNLEGNRIRTYIGVAVFLLAIGAVAFAVTQFAAGPDSSLGARASSDTDRNILSSPLAEREYLDVDGPTMVETFSAIDELFLDEGASAGAAGADGQVLVDGGDFPEESSGSIVAGPVFWAGRAHIALLGDVPVVPSGSCAITSLVTPGFEVVDVAGVGTCNELFEATGDRVACMSENLVLIEVWPLNPDAVTEQRAVSAVRTRIETPTDQGVVSRRGSLDLGTSSAGTPLVVASSTLAGSPGDTVTIGAADISAECSLLDRNDVDVRLLPG